ncbi:MAG TPA: FemAB family XrtA/PEP-CTERM system-associated protein [Methylomirabilota bacterium]|jgi:FemAB-related protein (PEP-CTERM system-associated)
MIDIVRLEQPDKTWDRFVEQHPAATVAHLGAWGPVITETYGHEVTFLAARDGDDVVGVLPLVLLRSRLFGRRLVSMPFLDYGGILAEPGSEAERRLADAALALAREHDVQTVGLRQFHPCGLGLPIVDDRVTMLLPLTTEQAVWKALPSERRNRVRKGQKNGLVSVWGGSDLLDDFYRVLSVNMRDLGSPIHGRGFFSRLLDGLGPGARVLLVRDAQGRTVGAALCMFFRDTIMVPWVSSLRQAFALCPNFTLYWEVIRFGCAEGYRVLDLGRSFRNKGTYEFKRQWGAEPYPLPWVFIDVVEDAPPSVDRDAGRFSPLVAAWKWLPLPLANTLGPWVRGRAPN